MDNRRVFVLHLWSTRNEKSFEKSHGVIQKHVLIRKFSVFFYLNLVSICTEQTLEFF